MLGVDIDAGFGWSLSFKPRVECMSRGGGKSKGLLWAFLGFVSGRWWCRTANLLQSIPAVRLTHHGNFFLYSTTYLRLSSMLVPGSSFGLVGDRWNWSGSATFRTPNNDPSSCHESSFFAINVGRSFMITLETRRDIAADFSNYAAMSWTMLQAPVCHYFSRVPLAAWLKEGNEIAFLDLIPMSATTAIELINGLLKMARKVLGIALHLYLFSASFAFHTRLIFANE